MFNHLQTFPNLCENCVFNVADVIFEFGSLKRKAHKVFRDIAPFKIHKKSLTIKQLKFSNKKFLI